MAFSQTATRVLESHTALDAVTLKYIVHGMRVTGTDTAADDEFKVTDTAGTVVFRGFATGVNFTDSISLDRFPMEGIIFATNTSDHFTLYVYIE